LAAALSDVQRADALLERIGSGRMLNRNLLPGLPVNIDIDGGLVTPLPFEIFFLNHTGDAE